MGKESNEDIRNKLDQRIGRWRWRRRRQIGNRYITAASTPPLPASSLQVCGHGDA
jgi:hypothetical protein